MTKFNPNDRTRTPSNRLGTVLKKPWDMPLHELILLDGQTEPRWLLSDILTLEARAQPAEPQPAAEPMVQVVAMKQLALFEDAAA